MVSTGIDINVLQKGSTGTVHVNTCILLFLVFIYILDDAVSQGGDSWIFSAI